MRFASIELGVKNIDFGAVAVGDIASVSIPYSVQDSFEAYPLFTNTSDVRVIVASIDSNSRQGALNLMFDTSKSDELGKKNGYIRFEDAGGVLQNRIPFFVTVYPRIRSFPSSAALSVGDDLKFALVGSENFTSMDGLKLYVSGAELNQTEYSAGFKSANTLEVQIYSTALPLDRSEFIVEAQGLVGGKADTVSITCRYN